METGGWWPVKHNILRIEELLENVSKLFQFSSCTPREMAFIDKTLSYAGATRRTTQHLLHCWLFRLPQVLPTRLGRLPNQLAILLNDRTVPSRLGGA